MGKGGGGVKVKTSPLEQIQADIAKRQDTRAQTMEQQWVDPIRGAVTPNILTALGTNPFLTTLSGPERSVYEGQYNQAKNALMNTAARGGQLRSQMLGLERDRANAIAGASQQARERGINRALQFAGGALPTAQGVNQQSATALQGLGQANQSASQRAVQQAQMQQQAEGAKGQGIGSLIGTGAMLYMMSSREAKEDIQPLGDGVLLALQATPVYTWRYTGETAVHVGPLTEEAPAAMVAEDGKHLDVVNYLGLLLASVKELTARVAALEGR